ncbi:MAG: hypothetical protein AB7I27_14180 [Bacteriovoracaceae bacterium]
MEYFLMVLSIFILSPAYAINCEWWQTKYSASSVDKHPRQGTRGVQEHPRKEYCRDKWKSAGLYLKQFKDKPIVGWPHNGEVFKKWNRAEIQTLLEILPTLPVWTEIKNYKFYRAIKSIHEGNSATSEVTYGSIILYDQFFKDGSRPSDLVHESGHHLFKKFSLVEEDEFASLSGWREEVAKDRKVYILPPVNLIKPDSYLNKEEDFTNHLEIFYENPKLYKQNHPKVFEFLQKRYPL